MGRNESVWTRISGGRSNKDRAIVSRIDMAEQLLARKKVMEKYTGGF
jgi:hypothetical protein